MPDSAPASLPASTVSDFFDENLKVPKEQVI
jgi:hypothetical protein